MKKLTLLALLMTVSLNAQVGIGTVTPQETLHVAGTTRVDSLGPTNLLNNGIASNVMVDANGTLILANGPADSVIVDDSNILPFPIGVNGGSTNVVVHSQNFTTTYERKVRFNTSISANYYRNGWYQPITNGQSRIIGCRLEVDGVAISRDRNNYSNHGDSNTVMTGYVYLKNAREVILPAGVHTVRLIVFVSDGGGNTFVEFGGNSVDVMSIIQD